MLLNKVHNSDEIDNINCPIPSKEIEFSIKNLPRRKLQARMASLVNSFKYSKRIIPIVHKLFGRFEEKGILPNSFHEATVIK